MAQKAGKRPLVVTVTVSLWTSGLVLAYLLKQPSDMELVKACWAASLVLLPVVIVDSRHSGTFSWLVVGGLLVPGVNLVSGAAYALSQFRRRHGDSNDQHGLVFFLGVFATGLSLVVTPYLFGPIALACGYLVRQRYSKSEGALLLTSAGVTLLFGLALNVILFQFVRPGPVL